MPADIGFIRLRYHDRRDVISTGSVLSTESVCYHFLQ